MPQTTDKEILIIGCVSLDTVHYQEKTVRRTCHTIGGAGLYTALSAACLGANVTLVAPRPRQRSPEFDLVTSKINWIGPAVDREQMPRLEIAHHGDGRATLLGAAWAAEQLLLPEDMQESLQHYKVIHIAALSSARKQLAFLRRCRELGAPLIAAGTYAQIARTETAVVKEILSSADLFFMNDNEANCLFGAASDMTAAVGKLLFVTNGKDGTTVYQGDASTHCQSLSVTEVDPTGAGDTFCGATLASLISGASVLESARAANMLAASCVEQQGPAALLARLQKQHDV